MRLAARLASALLACLLLTLVPEPPAADACATCTEHRECAYKTGGIGFGECQHFLRNPLGPTDDPCFCDRCRNATVGQRHDGRTLPAGWNPTLLEQGGIDHYLKRHSIAWGITCSECMTNDKPWPDGGGEKGLGTVPEKDFAGRPAKKTVLDRLAIEIEPDSSGKPSWKEPKDVVLAYNRHFYLVTDIGGLKVKMPGGSARIAGRHEWLHLMIERAEYARREWVRNLGEPIVMKVNTKRPIAVYLTERFRDFEKIGAKYFRNVGSRGLRGPVAELCDGMCLTGFTTSKEEAGDDRQLVVHLRHELSHNLLSMWGSLEVRPTSLPVWMDEGLSHWLVKSTPQLEDEVFYCVGEGLGGPSAGGARGVAGPAWSGKDWHKDVVKYVQGGKLGTIEEMLGRQGFLDLTETEQKRAWSLLDFGLDEMREPFAKLLTALRQEKPVRAAFTESVGVTPAQLDDRWRARVLGRRKSMAPSAADALVESEDAPGARDRASIASETDPRKLAFKLRQLGEIQDAKTVPFVVDVLSQNVDLTRETAFVALLGVKDAACREALWSYGLAHPDPIVRAYVARLCARHGITSALPKLEALLADQHWYARAEAAVACGAMKHAKAIAALRTIVSSDPSEKARVGAMDALAAFGERADTAAPAIGKMLDSAQWQLRIAAAQALGAIGSMEGVEPLVARLEIEPDGRIADDVYQALKRITRDDLGRKPENWRRWWEREKEKSPNRLPKRPEERKGPAPDDAHATREAAAPPTTFGIEQYSKRVAFVCDTSESMLELFTPDPAAAKALSRQYSGTDKLVIMKEEVTQALSALDPRAHFNLIAFGTQVKAFKETPIPATKANVEDAKKFLQRLPGTGETNYYDALKAALDLGPEPDADPDFKATPDTITFVTDGQPTKGDIVDAEVLVEWYTGLNRYARVTTHTITFGLVGVDVPLLKAMAERNGGRFTLVPEKPAPK